MTGLEITLVVTGVIFLIGSFLVKDKLSPKDIDKINDFIFVIITSFIIYSPLTLVY